MSVRKTILSPGQLLRSVHMEKRLPRQVGLPGVVQQVTRLLKLPRGNEKHCEQTSDLLAEAKFAPGSEKGPYFQTTVTFISFKIIASKLEALLRYSLKLFVRLIIDNCEEADVTSHCSTERSK